MKKFIKKISFFIPVIFLIIAINFFVDPAHIFNKSYEKGISNLLLKQKNVENVTNYDERLVQKFYVNNLNKKKEIIIIGSSRSMQIGKQVLNCNSIFNSSVSGASLEDYLAIYDLYSINNVIPEKIILGIDPWIFNKNNGQSRWQTLDKNYYNMLNNMGYKMKQKELKDNKYFQLISLTYFQNSLKYLLKNAKNKNTEYKATSKKKSKYNIKMSDGSLSYNKKHREANVNTVKEKASNYISGNVYSLENFNSLDKKSVNIIEDFIKKLENKNITVEFYLPPYHPIVYNYLSSSKDYSIINDVEKYIRRYSIKNNIKVWGSYNPSMYKLNEKYFYDGMHPKPSAMQKIFSSY